MEETSFSSKQLRGILLIGASIPWGDEAEIFIIAILGRKQFCLPF